MSHQTGYVFIAYQPANHFMFLQFLKTKEIESTVTALQNMFKYNEKYDQDFDYATFDDGNEFKGQFTELLQEDKIKIRRVNPNKDDHKILAALNSMCRYVRQQITKRVIEIDKEGQESGEDKLKVTASQLNRFVKDIMENHNTKRLIKPFDKAPIEITAEEIDQFNEMKLEHNYQVEEKFKFDLGDIVNVKLHKDQLQKGRHQKWSDGTYKVVGRDMQHYQITPCNFDSKRYKNYFQINDDMDTAPVYFRKSYEMRVSETQSLYFPAEMKEANHYLFDKILRTSPENVKIDKVSKYVIKVGNVQKVVTVQQIRNDKMELSDVERQFYFPSIYGQIEMDAAVFRV